MSEEIEPSTTGLFVCTRHREQHGFWPRKHAQRAIDNARIHAMHVRNALLVAERMEAHRCLICGEALVPWRAKG